MSGPGVFGLPHLSEDAVAAFADGVLSAPAAARAHRHCVECVECAQAVRGQREAARMLRAATAPSMPSGLLDRLSCLPMSATLPPPMGGLPTTLGADGVPMIVAYNPRGHRSQPQQQQAQASAVHASPGPIPHSVFGRRGVLPIGLLASAAAVVAVGTLGGYQSLARQPATPPAAANLSGIVSPGTPTSKAPSATSTAVHSNGGASAVAVPPGGDLAGVRLDREHFPGTAATGPRSAVAVPGRMVAQP